MQSEVAKAGFLCHPYFFSHDLPPLSNLSFTSLDNCHEVCSSISGKNATTSYPDLRLLLLQWDGDSSLVQREHMACALTAVHLETMINISEPVFKALAEDCPHLTHLIFYYHPNEKWIEGAINPDEDIQDEVQESEDTSDDSDDDEPGVIIDLPRPAVPKYRAGEFPLITHLALSPRYGQTLGRYAAYAFFAWLAAQMPPSPRVMRFVDCNMVDRFCKRYPRDLARGLEKLPGVRVEDHEGNDICCLSSPRHVASSLGTQASESIFSDEALFDF